MEYLSSLISITQHNSNDLTKNSNHSRQKKAFLAIYLCVFFYYNSFFVIVLEPEYDEYANNKKSDETEND